MLVLIHIHLLLNCSSAYFIIYIVGIIHVAITVLFQLDDAITAVISFTLHVSCVSRARIIVVLKEILKFTHSCVIIHPQPIYNISV